MKTKQNFYTILLANHIEMSILAVLFFFTIDIFYPSGEPTSLQSLRCSSFKVVHYIFMSHCLAFAAISAREQSRKRSR